MRNSSCHVKANNTTNNLNWMRFDMLTNAPILPRLNVPRTSVLALPLSPRWLSQYKNHEGDIPARESGNYELDKQKEISRLKRERRNA